MRRSGTATPGAISPAMLAAGTAYARRSTHARAGSQDEIGSEPSEVGPLR
ncbi:hypothetical protein ACWDPV_16015 [Gordonia sp. NPDC003504]